MNIVFLYVIDCILIISCASVFCYSFHKRRKIIDIKYIHLDNDNALKYSSDYISIEDENIENKIIVNEIDSLV